MRGDTSATPLFEDEIRREQNSPTVVRFGGMETQMDLPIHLVTCVYSIVFVVGVTGNFWVIFNMLRSRLWSNGSPTPMSASQRSRVYIFVLAISDLLLLLTIPSSVLFIQKADWILGELLCHIHLAVDIFAKLFSVFVLTAMSLERYFIVCTRWRHSFNKAITTAIPMCVALLLFVIAPMSLQIYYTELVTIELPVVTESGDEIIQAHKLCVPMMTDDLFNKFAHYMFFTGFAGPLVVMTLCYIRLVRHVKRKFRLRCSSGRGNPGKLPREPRYMGEMKKSIWRVAIYHFVCWAPFWFFTITPTFLVNMQIDSDFLNHPVWRALHLFVNILPTINAAGNWVLYALLNNDVRKHLYSHVQQQKKKSLLFGSFTLN